MLPMAIGSMATSMIGSFIGYSGAKAEGQALYNQGMYQSAIAKMNADIARENANRATMAGQSEAELKMERGSQILGAQKAGFAAGNISVQSGSPVDVANSTHRQIQMDAATIMRNAGDKAFAFLSQAAGFDAEAVLDQNKAAYGKQAGYYKAMSSLVGGASSFSKSAVDFQQAGVFKGFA